MWNWLKRAWAAIIDLARRIGRRLCEDLPWPALTALAGLFLGALASLLLLGCFRDADKNRQKEPEKNFCSFNSVASVLAEDQREAVQKLWSADACKALLDDQTSKLPQVFLEKSDELKTALVKAREEALKYDPLQFFRVLVAACAMFWLYAFNPDIFLKRRRPAPAGAQGAGVAPGAAAAGAQAGTAAAAPRNFYHVLSKNWWALVCFGFASSVCVFFSASIAGTAAASLVTTTIERTTQTLKETIRESQTETIRELHFAQFPADEIDRRAYDRLAWHFFFEKGGFPGESGCTKDTEKKECPVPNDKNGFDSKSFDFIADLDTADIQSRLTSIIDAVSECAGGKAVSLRLAAQSSRLEWCGCNNSEDLNAKLAELRAEKLRKLFNKAVETLDDSISEKVSLAPGVKAYDFDFSDQTYHETRPVESKGKYSPYYLSQTVALVLEDPSRCALKAPPSGAE